MQCDLVDKIDAAVSEARDIGEDEIAHKLCELRSEAIKAHYRAMYCLMKENEQ